MRRITLALLALWLSGCATVVTHESFAQELVHRDRPSSGFLEVGDEVFLAQGTIDSVRRLVEEGGGSLLAILQFPTGVHPYSVLLLVDRGAGVDVRSTSVYWGMIQEKQHGRTELPIAQSLIQMAASTYKCSPEAVSETLFGAAMVFWPAGDQVLCDGGWLSEEVAKVGEAAQAILDEASTVFEAKP